MNNESILFLDVDGVLNTRPGSLDSDKLDLVRWIVTQTGCRIVLSSSWRLVERQRARICAELPIWRVTPEIGTWERGNEVRAFLGLYAGNYQSFAILDDYPDGWGWLEPFLVLTDERVGLTPEKAADVVRLLNDSSSATSGASS